MTTFNVGASRDAINTIINIVNGEATPPAIIDESGVVREAAEQLAMRERQVFGDVAVSDPKVRIYSPVGVQDIEPLISQYFTDAVRALPFKPSTVIELEEHGERTLKLCQFLTNKIVMSETDGLAENDIKEFARLINRLVERGDIRYGRLAPTLLLPLAPLRTDAPGTRRALLLFYAFTDFSREELNARLGVEAFTDEGAVSTGFAWDAVKMTKLKEILTHIKWTPRFIAFALVGLLMIVAALVLMITGNFGAAERMFLRLIMRHRELKIDKLDDIQQVNQAAVNVDDQKIQALQAQRQQLERERVTANLQIQGKSHDEIVAHLRDSGL